NPVASSPPPIRVGSRARQIRVDHGRRSDTIVQTVALEPNRHVAFTSHGSPAFTSAFDFIPRGDATALQFHFALTELKLYMRPFESLIRRAIQDGTERTVTNIRALIEAER
ncbi:MAG: polyketide cyclase, partial [Halofilum sp. (in: g-proteobacteria)]